MQYVKKPFTITNFADEVVKPTGHNKIASNAYSHYLDIRMDVRKIYWMITEASK